MRLRSRCFRLGQLEADVSASADPEQTKKSRAELRHCQFTVDIRDEHYSQDKCPHEDLEPVETG
jgi:hypothetical protein